MVIPLGGAGGDPMMEEMPAPECVQKQYGKFWWSMLAVYVVMMVARFYSGDTWGGIVSLFMGVWTFFLVQQNLKYMTQSCLFIYGIFAIFQFIMDLIIVLSVVHGRASETASATPVASANGATTIDYSITVTSHPFFCGKLGFMYNFQSAMLIAIPVMDLCALLLAYFTYNAFPNSMFALDDDAEAGRGFGRGGYGGGYGGGGYGGGYGNRGGNTFQADGIMGGRVHQQPRSGVNNNSFQTSSGNRLDGGSSTEPELAVDAADLRAQIRPIDPDAPTLALRVRLPDKKQVSVSFNGSHTIGQVRAFLQVNHADAFSGPYSLMDTGGFPPKKLADLGQTLDEAGVKSGSSLDCRKS